MLLNASTYMLYINTADPPPADSPPSVYYSTISHGYAVLSSRPNQANCSVLHRARMKGLGELKP